MQLELAELEEKSRVLTSRWSEEKKALQSVQKLKEDLDKARQELEIAQRKGNLARAGELAYGRSSVGCDLYRSSALRI